MAKWERLVVYSLLLVALFMGFRSNQQLITAMEGVSEEIRAKRFVVVNELGREMVVLDSSREGGGLVVLNNEGMPVGALGAGAAGGGVFGLWNPRGDERISMGSTTQDHGGIWVYDRNGKDIRFYGHR